MHASSTAHADDPALPVTPARPAAPARRPILGIALIVSAAVILVASRLLSWGTWTDPTGELPPIEFVGENALFAVAFLAAGVGALVAVAMMLVLPRYVPVWAVFAGIAALGALQMLLFIRGQVAEAGDAIVMTPVLTAVTVAVPVLFVGSVLAFLRR